MGLEKQSCRVHINHGFRIVQLNLDVIDTTFILGLVCLGIIHLSAAFPRVSICRSSIGHPYSYLQLAANVADSNPDPQLRRATRHLVVNPLKDQPVGFEVSPHFMQQNLTADGVCRATLSGFVHALAAIDTGT